MSLRCYGYLMSSRFNFFDVLSFDVCFPSVLIPCFIGSYSMFSFLFQLKSTILTVLFAVIQIIALIW